MNQPLFVLGMNGSGTTMLLDSLGRHSSLYAYPHETRLLPHLLADTEKYGDLQDDNNYLRLWSDLLDIPALKRRAISLPNSWAQAPRTMAGAIDTLFTSLASKDGNIHWCEKSPMNVQHIPLLAAEFPNARFIHMIRDGRDCAASFQRRWSRSPTLSIFRWKKAVTQGRIDGQAIPQRYLEVRYEDLTDAPQEQLQRVCDFLELDFEDVILQSSQPYLKSSWHNDKAGTIEKNDRTWRNYFKESDVVKLESIAGLLLDQCGYPVINSEGDVNLTRIRRKLLMLKDQIRQFANEVYLKATGKIERPWHQILSKPFTAIKQNRGNNF